MNRETVVEKVRKVSRAKDDGPWVDWWDEMARKTVFRRLAKRLPSSADLEQALEADNEVVGFVQQQGAAALDPDPAPAILRGKPTRTQAIVEAASKDDAPQKKADERPEDRWMKDGENEHAEDK